MPPRTSLSRVIEARRKAKALTQAELAKRAKVKQSYVAMLESGERQNPSLAILKRLARALGVPVTELLG